MNQNWIRVISFFDYNEANIVNAMLESNGISVVMEDKATISNYSEAFMHGTINIFVPYDQVDASVMLLNESGYEVGNTETEFEKKLAKFFARIKNLFSKSD